LAFLLCPTFSGARALNFWCALEGKWKMKCHSITIIGTHVLVMSCIPVTNLNWITYCRTSFFVKYVKSWNKCGQWSGNVAAFLFKKTLLAMIKSYH
jgi:hypothetical protein